MMSKRYNLLISNPDVVRKLDSLPERSKGAYVTEAILEKLANEEKRFSPQDNYQLRFEHLEQRILQLEKELKALKKPNKA